MALRKSVNFYFMTFLFVALATLFSGCGKAATTKKPEEMAFNELKTRVMDLLNKRKNEQAIVHLEQLIASYPENQDIFEYKFILADLYLKVGRLDEAYSLYTHYTMMYPSESRAEEAHYKSILSKFYQTLKLSKKCDDTDTQYTLAQCKSYLKKRSFQKYTKDVKDIQHTCERRLIDKEIYVFNTYLRRSKFLSARNRLDGLRKNFLDRYPSIEAQILYLESKLAHKQKKGEVAKQKVEVLFAKFPESRFTKMAHSMISAKKRTFIF